ncbi:MAG: hypothetical protein OdinLCB4_002065 [Candidatus Odinarchaeum yellowstonii]|uniref:Uncharacterized protein n=1 Tax=Odinarchaeota yellowstonii (strain LCB_4) TaxID=1841599 RepID=A0AAF0D2Z0_ODILC|nr:MAG: hypothetical protein OdinLCB4_002065 [Candidatus Odinarchaeum yellowstonii]
MSLLNKNNLTVKIVGGAVFSAISIGLALSLSPIVPRVPGWGIAFIDPVSIIWVLCFLIFGLLAGLICSFSGFAALFYVDPFIPWGPLFKLTATLPLIIIPYILIKYFKNQEGEPLGLGFEKPSSYILFTLPAIAVRCAVMGVINIFFFMFILGEGAIIAVGGLPTILIIAVAINAEQSIWDLYIPWILTYPTKIYRIYKLW